MSDTSFSIRLAYKRGWIAAKSNIKMALLAACVWMVIGHVNFFQFLISSHTGAILSRTGAIGFRIVGFLVSSFLSIGLLRMCFDMYDRRAINLNTLFSGADLFVLFVVAAIFYLGIVGGGFLLLIVPGVIWGVKYSFYDLCGYTFPYLHYSIALIINAHLVEACELTIGRVQPARLPVHLHRDGAAETDPDLCECACVCVCEGGGGAACAAVVEAMMGRHDAWTMEVLLDSRPSRF